GISNVECMLAGLRLRCAHMIIDSSPVGHVADSFSIARYAHSTLLIVRYNYSFNSQLGLLQDIYQNKKLNHPMIVLNDAKKETGHEYGYGYGNGQKRDKVYKLL